VSGWPASVILAGRERFLVAAVVGAGAAEWAAASRNVPNVERISIKTTGDPRIGSPVMRREVTCAD
jgi:hypothetical protein